MFESRLKEISDKVLYNHDKRKYFILTNKKHRREMYFILGDKNALNFSRPKFNSKKKKIIFFLLKTNILQLFLKKIYLSKDIGNVIFVGGQIKGFDLRNKVVNSFYHTEGTHESFIKDKRFQIRMSKEGFSPSILNIDENNVSSKEELFYHFSGDSKKIFDRLLEFYDISSLKKKNAALLMKKIKKQLNERKINDPLINKTINILNGMDYFLYGNIHGDFAKEQCLIKDGKIFFVDWCPKEGVLTEDLVNFFRADKGFFTKKEFKEIIKKYPVHIKKHLKEYLLVTELLRIIQYKTPLEFSYDRIKEILNTI